MRKNYYITTHGTLKKKDNTLELEPKEGDTKKIPVKKANSLHLMAQLDFNTRFYTFLSKEKIPAHFYDWFDYYRGSYYPKEFLNSGLVVVRQSEHYNTPEKRLKISREIVRGASHNMLKNLRYYRNKGKDVQGTIDEIEILREQINDVKSPDEMLGVEGKIRERYYSCFDEILRQSFVFNKRAKQPPDNEVNAMISFGNSLLYTNTLNEIYRTQLNPTVSYLHEPRERRYSLSLDISEIFKPLLVDRTIFKLVNKQMIQTDDFEKEVGSCLLDDTGKETFIEEFESRLEKTKHYDTLDKDVSYQRMLRLESYKLIKHVLDDQEYSSYKE
jgi:CRISPR-associated protein Cas1